jgi:hypothetical protein
VATREARGWAEALSQTSGWISNRLNIAPRWGNE